MKYKNTEGKLPNEFKGCAFSGVPGLGMGRNNYVAWGVTLGFTDVQDIYILTPDPNNANHYLVDGKSLPLNVTTQTIKTMDAGTVTIQVRNSIFGNILGDSSTLLPAFRWTANLDNDTSINGVYSMLLSTNWEEFRTSVNQIKSVVFNYAFSDVNGNVGYKLSGLIPIRREGHTGRYPVKGDTMAYDYDGYVPIEKAPELYNPPRGYISSANNRIVPPGYPYLISADYFFDYRQRRIQKLMTDLFKNTTRKFNVQDMVNIQLDTYSTIYSEYRFMFVNMSSAVSKLAITKNATQVKPKPYTTYLQQVIDWDGYETYTSKEASLFETFLRFLGTMVSKEMGDATESTKLPLWYFYKDAMLRNNDPACLTKGYATCTDYAASVFVQAVDYLYLKFGYIPMWKELHTTPIYHIAGKDTIIIGCLSEILLKTEGGTETVLLNNMDEDFNTNEGPVYRQIISFDSVTKDRWILPTGNDGNIFSNSYDNMGPLYASGKYLEIKSTTEATIQNSYTIVVQ